MSEETSAETISNRLTQQAKNALLNVKHVPQLAVIADEDTDLTLINDTLRAAIAGLMVETIYADLSTVTGMIASATALGSKKTSKRLITLTDDITDAHRDDLTDEELTKIKNAYANIAENTEDRHNPTTLDTLLEKDIPLLLIPGTKALIVSGDEDDNSEISEIDINFYADVQTPTAYAFRQAVEKNQTVRMMLPTYLNQTTDIAGNPIRQIVNLITDQIKPIQSVVIKPTE